MTNDTPARPSRPHDDAYWTKPEATRGLLSVEAFGGPIWEPCAGAGWLAEVLREAGHTVKATTLYGSVHERDRPKRQVKGGIDFFAERSGHPNIITNPPYRLAEECVRHALSLPTTVKVAMWLDLSFLGSQGRGEGLHAEWPPVRVWVSSSRVTMWPAGHEDRKGSTTQTHAWFVWERFRHSPPALGWFNSAKFR